MCCKKNKLAPAKGTRRCIKSRWKCNETERERKRDGTTLTVKSGKNMAKVDEK